MTSIPDEGEGKAVAWMWFEGFGQLPGSPFNSTTDEEVAKAMTNLGLPMLALKPTSQADLKRFTAAITSIIEEAGE